MTLGPWPYDLIKGLKYIPIVVQKSVEGLFEKIQLTTFDNNQVKPRQPMLNRKTMTVPIPLSA